MENKICSVCKEEKLKTNFYKHSKHYVNSMCKKCFNEYCQIKAIQKKKKAVEFKGRKCIKCGYNKNYAALDFHHRNKDEKEMDWTTMRRRNWESIISELNKCDLLCRNCHAEEHNPKANLEV